MRKTPSWWDGKPARLGQVQAILSWRLSFLGGWTWVCLKRNCSSWGHSVNQCGPLFEVGSSQIWGLMIFPNLSICWPIPHFWTKPDCTRHFRSSCRLAAPFPWYFPDAGMLVLSNVSEMALGDLTPKVWPCWYAIHPDAKQRAMRLSLGVTASDNF